MKAHEILMFLLIFNLVLWLLGGYGLNLYRLDVYDEGSGITGGTDVLESGDIGTQEEIGIAFLAEISGTIMLFIISSATAMAVAGYLLRTIPTPQLIISGAFAGLFVTSYVKAIQVFYSIIRGFDDASVAFGIFLAVLLVFSAITAYSFIFGFSQIITGSWRYMK